MPPRSYKELEKYVGPGASCCSLVATVPVVVIAVRMVWATAVWVIAMAVRVRWLRMMTVLMAVMTVRMIRTAAAVMSTVAVWMTTELECCATHGLFRFWRRHLV